MDSNDQSTQSDSPLSDEIQTLLDETYTSDVLSSRRYSGDGTWIESHLIFALVAAPDREVAVSKAVAALAHRDGRPDPLFDHKASDTFDLLAGLDSIPLTVQETPWERADPLAKVDGLSDEHIRHLLDVSPFSASDTRVVSEWGSTIQSKEELESELNGFSEQGWLIAGIALAPLGAGEGNDEYIGNTYEVYCPNCDHTKQAKCINVTHDESEGIDAGIWVCETCREDYRGTHPRGPAKLSRRDPRP